MIQENREQLLEEIHLPGGQLVDRLWYTEWLPHGSMFLFIKLLQTVNPVFRYHRGAIPFSVHIHIRMVHIHIFIICSSPVLNYTDFYHIFIP